MHISTPTSGLNPRGLYDVARTAIANAEHDARTAHENGTCEDSEWSCSFCEAEDLRLSALVVPRVAYISVPLEDDSDRLPPRPDVLEIIAANEYLKRQLAEGALDDCVAAPVRVLLGVVGRLSAGEVAEAFPPAAPRLRSVDGPSA